VIEQRRFARAQIDCPLTFVTKGQPAETAQPNPQIAGIGKDISIGGMFVETDKPAAFNAEVTVSLQLPGTSKMLSLPARVRWVRQNGMGVQFGLLGVHETHAITELSRKA
jgi:hypothetical protein